MQETLICNICKWNLKGHGYWLKLWFQNVFNRCKSCGNRNFTKYKVEPDERKVMRKHNQTNELYHVPGENAIRMLRSQMDKAGNQFTKKDLEAGNFMVKYRKSRFNKILEKKAFR